MSTTINQKADKRSRLIEAANDLFHQQGVNITTLANIAALAEVPLGNVYYYFKSKESIVLTVIEQRRKAIQQLFASWNTLFSAPKARLKAFIEQSITFNPETMAYGDALGSLCQELGKQGGEIALAAAGLMKEVLNFCETQFKAIHPEQAEVRALHLVSSLQGTNLLTLTFKEPLWVEKQNNNLIDWLETL
jgi:AcrR family transcriptional regulator